MKFQQMINRAFEVFRQTMELPDWFHREMLQRLHSMVAEALNRGGNYDLPPVFENVPVDTLLDIVDVMHAGQEPDGEEIFAAHMRKAANHRKKAFEKLARAKRLCPPGTPEWDIAKQSIFRAFLSEVTHFYKDATLLEKRVVMLN